MAGTDADKCSFQWQVSVSGAAFRDIRTSAAKRQDLVMAATPTRVATQRYRCVVTGPDGSTATTRVVTFDVAE